MVELVATTPSQEVNELISCKKFIALLKGHVTEATAVGMRVAEDNRREQAEKEPDASGPLQLSKPLMAP